MLDVIQMKIVIVNMPRGMVHHNHCIGHDSVQQTERYARISLMRQGALSFDMDKYFSVLDPFINFKLNRPGDIIADDGIDGNAFSGKKNSRLPGCHEIRIQSTTEKF